MECELHRKLDLLWAFIKQHLRSRTLVFVSTCKQARCRPLNPKLSILDPGP